MDFDQLLKLNPQELDNKGFITMDINLCGEVKKIHFTPKHLLEIQIFLRKVENT